MRELLLIEDTLANKISYFHLALFLVSLPFYLFYSHLILISFAIHTLIHFNRASLKPIFTWRTLALQSVFFVTVISTIYAANKALAFSEWGLDITILFIPILFCINQLDLKKYRPQLLLAFALGCSATIIYLYINAFITIRFYHLSPSLLFSSTFTNHNFSQPIDIHATFFSLQIAIAFIYTLSALVKEKSRTNRAFYTMISLILLAGIIQLSSKAVFAALFLSINIAFPYFLLDGVRRKRFLLISASLTAIIIAGIFGSQTLRERYVTELRNDFSQVKISQTEEPRLLRWEIAGGLIRQSPIIGHGAGSEIPLLTEQYFAKKYYTSYLHRLNAHNQYLSFLLKSGIWGLAVYLATLAYGFRKAIRKKDIIFFTFMMLVAIVSLSENILDADKGVMFYSFFFPLCVFIADQKDKALIPIRKHKNLRQVATKTVNTPSLV